MKFKMRLIFLLSTCLFSIEALDYTLLDLIKPHSTQRLFDTLSSAVESEYAGQVIGFDESTVIKFEEKPVDINKLNEKYREYLFEGDMLIQPHQLEDLIESSVDGEGERKKRQAYRDRLYPSTIWSAGVPYVLHPSLTGSARQSVLRAIHFWQRETCINFFHRTNEKQFLHFIGNDEGCWSTVGRDTQQGRQVVSIGPGCEHFGVTSHELAHALGVFHEQSRWDRDNSIRVNTRVVNRNLLFNFAKVSKRELSIYDLPYDIGSVMHYTPTEFSRVPSVPVLTSIDPNLQQTMGQLEGPSFLDVAILNQHYQCFRRCLPLSCQNGGIVDSRNCSQCKCPSGFSGQHCEQVAPSFSRGCGGVMKVEEAVRRFDITIRQIGTVREKQCIYHMQAPPGKRILVNLIEVHGRCIEGCWEDGIEFKMREDVRPVGYRFCCSSSSRRRMFSSSSNVPFIVTSRVNTISLTFEYTSVDAEFAHDGVHESHEKGDHPVTLLESTDDHHEGVETSISLRNATKTL